MSDSIKKRILLVEDEAILAMTEKKRLEKYGYAVSTVGTGEKAVEAVQTSTDIDLILMDIDLGQGIDGTEAAEIILKDREIPVVFLSSHTEPEMVEKTEKITSYGYVVKNSSITVLDASIKMAFRLFDSKVNEYRKEESLRQSEERLRQITESMEEVFWLTNRDNTEMLYVSPSYEEVWGRSCQSLYDDPESFMDAVHEQDKPAVYAAFENNKNGEKSDLEYRITRPEGDIRWVRTQSFPVKNDRGEIVRNSGIAMDVTERKRAEEKLEKRLVALTQPLDDSDGIDFQELFSLPELQNLQEEFARATGVASIITQPDGTPITKPSNFRHLCEGIIRKTKTGCANCYQSDAVLGQPNPNGPTVQPCLSGGLWDAGTAISVGGRHIANWLIGQVRDETQSEEKMRAYARVIGADEEAVVEAFRDVPAMSHEQFKRVASALFTFATQLSNTAYQNVQQARLLTERKRAEEAMREQRDFSENLIETGQTIILVLDAYGCIVRFNPYTEKLLGYTLDEVKGKNWVETFVRPDDSHTVKTVCRKTMIDDRTVGNINAITAKDGGTILVDWHNKPLKDADGQTIGVLATGIDITERKQVEEDLRTISEMQTIILRMASDYFDKSTEHVDETINDSLKEIGEFVKADRAYVFEYDWVTDVANNTYEWCNAGVNPQIDNLQDCLNSDARQLVEAHKNGREFSINNVMHLPPDDGVRQALEPQGIKSIVTIPMMSQGACIGFVGFDSVRETKEYSETERTLLKAFSEMLVNIGHRKELEEELVHAKVRAEENSADLSAIVEGATESIWSFDENYDIRYINDRFRSDFHAAFGVWLDKGSNLIDALPEALRPIWKPRYDKVLSNEQFLVTDEVETVSGKQFLQVSFNPIVHGDRVIGGSCFGSDITDRKIAEIEIQKQLDEKETLLREVHHRVKNNMATIESLLSLEIGSTAHAEVKAALQDTIARVQSTRVLYDKLLVSDNLNEVSVQPYANGLIDAIVRVFDLENPITIERDIADFVMRPKKAFILGIIINELLTNVFKYAFKDQAGGKASVFIGKEESTVTLIVQDNGVGFDERALKNESPGFGLTVVKMLVEQVGGTYNQSNDNGAKSVVRFEL